MIDFHAHIGTLYRDEYPQKVSLNAHQLVNRMDREGIDKSVLLPLESPEGGWGWLLTEEVIQARNMYPNRIIPFCCFDPRDPKATQLIEHFVNNEGCMGFGEHVNGLAFDDPKNMQIYAKCDELGLPLDFEINADLCYDDAGLPRLEACLQQFPGVKFVGHGPGYWSAISADDPRGGYPDGPVQPGGAVDRLLSEYDNMYADLSAGSGWNAMSRDPEFTIEFIHRHWRKLLFGTDITHAGQQLPQIQWIKSIDIASDIREAIMNGNARRVLGLDD